MSHKSSCSSASCGVLIGPRFACHFRRRRSYSARACIAQGLQLLAGQQFGLDAARASRRTPCQPSLRDRVRLSSRRSLGGPLASHVLQGIGVEVVSSSARSSSSASSSSPVSGATLGLPRFRRRVVVLAEGLAYGRQRDDRRPLRLAGGRWRPARGRAAAPCAARRAWCPARGSTARAGQRRRAGRRGSGTSRRGQLAGRMSARPRSTASPADGACSQASVCHAAGRRIAEVDPGDVVGVDLERPAALGLARRTGSVCSRYRFSPGPL